MHDDDDAPADYFAAAAARERDDRRAKAQGARLLKMVLAAAVSAPESLPSEVRDEALRMIEAEREED